MRANSLWRVDWLGKCQAEPHRRRIIDILYQSNLASRKQIERFPCRTHLCQFVGRGSYPGQCDKRQVLSEHTRPAHQDDTHAQRINSIKNLPFPRPPQGGGSLGGF